MRLILDTLRLRKGDTADAVGQIVIPIVSPAQAPASGDVLAINGTRYQVTSREWIYDGQQLLECRIRAIAS